MFKLQEFNSQIENKHKDLTSKREIL